MMILAVLVYMLNFSAQAMLMPLAVTDTLPPPPPPNCLPLTGPTEACLGETDTYFAEVPLTCACEWRINGVLLPDTTPVVDISWTVPGQQILTLLFVCEGGTSPPQVLLVEVTPPPVVVLGNDTTILQGQTVTLDAGNPGSSFLWSTGATTQTITVSTPATYSVTVSNDCGSDWDDIVVNVLVGIHENESLFDGKIYFDGQFIHIEKGSEEISEIQIIDATGRSCYLGVYQPSIDLPASGIFIIKITSEKGCFMRKILAL